MHEWPLLIFSYMVQIAMGGTLGLLITLKMLKKSEVDPFQIAKLPLIVFTVFALIGSGAAFLHLGKPTNVFHVIMNVGSSWFSREILCVGIFILFLLITLIVSLKAKKVNEALLLVTSILGFLTVPVMGGIYATTNITAWNGLGTFAIFYGTYFMAGAVLVAVLVRNQDMRIYKNLFRMALLGLAVKFVVLPVHYAGLADTLSGTQQTLLYAGLIFSALGVFGLACIVFSKKGYHFAWFGLVCVLIFIGEFLARYEFFTHAI